MMKPKRYHPLTILFDIVNYIKSAIFVFFILFIFNMNSESFIFKYGRYTFIIITILVILNYIVKWFSQKYLLTENAFHLYKGLFSRTEQIVPVDKIQNINRQTKFLHRLFHLTSLHLETAMKGDTATVVFQVLSTKEAERIEAFIEVQPEVIEEEDDKKIDNKDLVEEKQDGERKERTVYFRPDKRDLLRASFTSMSFLIFIPIIFSLYVKLDKILDMEERAENVLAGMLGSWWIVAGVIVLVAGTSIVYGILSIRLKYGKYEISSDVHRIYITQGTLNESSFAISKKNVQAIAIEQSLMKRLLGLAEVKLISAGNVDIEDDEVQINSLFPFLPVKNALDLLNKLLPEYNIVNKMSSLPPQALFARIIRSSWFFILTSIGLSYFKPSIYGFKEAWGIIILLLFIIMAAVIYFNYKHTKIILNEQFIQIKEGGIATAQLISRRDKIIEVKVERSLLQRKLGLATIEIINRANPVRHTVLKDVENETATLFYTWYIERTKEIELEDVYVIK